MAMYNLLEYNHNYLKISESLSQYYRDGPALNTASTLDNFPSNSASFTFKWKITGSTGDSDTKAV